MIDAPLLIRYSFPGQKKNGKTCMYGYTAEEWENRVCKKECSSE